MDSVIRIDLGALARNYRRMRRAAPQSECAAVVKADAYGLGISRIAERLYDEGCHIFFVATLDEGASLRVLLPDARIYVLGGPTPGTEERYSALRLRPVLNSLDQVRAWKQHCDRSAACTALQHAALHLDTGMERLGLAQAEWLHLVENLSLLDAMHIDFIMTHLACADEPSHGFNADQIQLFDRLRRSFPSLPTSIGNSAGTLLGKAFQGDIVRPGIGLYGGNPFSKRSNPMEVVAHLIGRVTQIREVRPMSSIGYAATFRKVHGGRIATVAVGYADGYPRSLGNVGSVVISDRLLPVVGHISMDMLSVDVTDVPSMLLHVGTPVELIGEKVDVDHVARQAGTISNEILTGLSKRLRRQYVN